MAKMKTREMMAEASKMPGTIGNMARMVMRQPGFPDWANIMDILSRITSSFDRREQDIRDQNQLVFRRPLRRPNPDIPKRSLMLTISPRRRG